ncbi:MAG: DsrE family protein [Gammaproteobacteria bacterium]|nr:DsrE family protein [Gammaproteobacteria bacterium]
MKHGTGSASSSWRRRSFNASSAFVLLLVLLGIDSARANDDVDALLARSEPPHGVVFEIVEADESALDELLPKLRVAITRIRAAFPQTEFAVVSHGREEFALQTRYQDENAQIHQQVQALVAEDVPVHVCETHAGWYGVSAEDFPDYVDVAPTGPGQVSLYQELGYDLIVIE